MNDIEMDLDDILEAPTKMRNEVETITENNGDDFDLSGLEFEEEEEQQIVDEINEAIGANESSEIALISEKDARDGAEMVVDLIDTFNSISLTPLAKWKLKRKIGGSRAVREMQRIWEKKANDKELTDKEEKMLWQYTTYRKDKEEIENIVPFSKEERDKLVKKMTSYFKKKNIKFSGDYSFWAELAMIEGLKITQVLTV